jgi:hypothetical protein
MFGLPVAWFRRDRQKATNDQNGSGRLIRIQTAAMVDNRAVFPMSRYSHICDKIVECQISNIAFTGVDTLLARGCEQ